MPLVLMLAGAVMAQPPPAPRTETSREFVVRSWGVDDGLPHGMVNAWVQDAQGFIWLATAAGLTRFDGLGFRLHPLPEDRARMSYNIRDLAREGPDALVMLPGSGGVVRFRGGDFTEHPASAALSEHTLLDLFVEPEGGLWLGTEDDEVLHWSAGRLRVFSRNDGINHRATRFTFARDRQGRTWVAGGDFVGWHEGGRLRALEGVGGQAIVIAPARSGGIWIATFGRLLKWERGQLATVATGPAWPIAASGVHHLFEDQDGTLWIATSRHGLYRWARGGLARVATPNPQVTRIGADREGLVWITMNGGGISRAVHRPFVLLNAESGLPESISSSVSADATGAVWCANRSGGLVRYLEGKAETVPLTGGEEPRPIPVAVCADLAGNIWCGTTTGLYRASAAPPFRPTRIPGLSGPVRVVHAARSGEVWLGTGDGELGFLRGGTYHQVVPDRDSSEQRITAITEHPSGGIWAATREGALFEWRDGSLHTHLAGGPDSHPQRINYLRFDRAGTLWIASPRGLMSLEEGRLRTFGREDGLPDDNIDHLIEDDDGRMWCAGSIGLFHVSLTALKSYVRGQSQPIRGVAFGRNDGLAGTSSFMGGQPLSSRSPDGRLWFATHRGVVGLDPRELSRDRPPPSVYIDEVRIDDHPVPLTKPLRIPAGNHRVDFRFVALDFAAPENVRVRHQLLGMDEEWIDTSRERLAAYARLPAGRYVLKVLASGPEDAGAASEASLEVTVVPAWWRTGWVLLVGLAAFTVWVAWLARRWSHRRLRKKLVRLEHEHALEMERARIARDLHDELGGGITQIKLLAERMRRHGGGAGSQPDLAKLAWSANRLTADLQSIVWTVSPRNNTWDRLARFIGQFALRFFRETGVQCHLEGLDDVPARPLAPETQHHLLAVIKEGMNNVLKHARASQVTLALRVAGDDFLLDLRDDGVGFRPDDPRHAASNGLNNMRSRIHELGGTIEIFSTPGRGTAIMVRLKLDHPGERNGTSPRSVAAIVPLP